MSRTLSTPSSSETQARLSSLLQETRDRQSRNLAALARLIEEGERPVEGTSPRSQPPTMQRPDDVYAQMEMSRERQRIAQVRATLPVVSKGSGEFGASIVDRIRAGYDARRRK